MGVEDEAVLDLVNDLFRHLGDLRDRGRLIGKDLRCECRAELQLAGAAFFLLTECPMMWTRPFFSKPGFRAIHIRYILLACWQTASIMSRLCSDMNRGISSRTEFVNSRMYGIDFPIVMSAMVKTFSRSYSLSWPWVSLSRLRLARHCTGRTWQRRSRMTEAKAGSSDCLRRTWRSWLLA